MDIVDGSLGQYKHTLITIHCVPGVKTALYDHPKNKQLYGLQKFCTFNGDDVMKCQILQRSIYEYFLAKDYKIFTAIVLNFQMDIETF